MNLPTLGKILRAPLQTGMCWEEAQEGGSDREDWRQYVVHYILDGAKPRTML